MLQATEVKDYKVSSIPLIYIASSNWDDKESKEYKYFTYLQPYQLQKALVGKTLICSDVKPTCHEKSSSMDMICRNVLLTVGKSRNLNIDIKLSMCCNNAHLNNVIKVRFTTQTQVMVCESLNGWNDIYNVQFLSHNIHSLVLHPVSFHNKFDELLVGLQHTQTLSLLYGIIDQFTQSSLCTRRESPDSGSASNTSIFHSKVLVTGKSGNGCSTLLQSMIRQRYAANSTMSIPKQRVVVLTLSGVQLIQHGKTLLLERLKHVFQCALTHSIAAHTSSNKDSLHYTCIVIIEDLHALTPMISNNMSIEQIDLYHVLIQGIEQLLSHTSSLSTSSPPTILLICCTYEESLLPPSIIESFHHKIHIHQKLTYDQQMSWLTRIVPEIVVQHQKITTLEGEPEGDKTAEEKMKCVISNFMLRKKKAMTRISNTEDLFAFAFLRSLFAPYSMQLQADLLQLVVTLPSSSSSISSSITSSHVQTGRTSKFYDFNRIQLIFEQSILWPRKYTSIYQLLHIPQYTISSHMLLYGPTGCGKSSLPLFLAQQYHYYYLPIQLTDLIQGEIGSSEKRIQQLFQDAKQKAPCIIFIDEFDCLFASEGTESSGNGQHSTVISTLLHGIDDITSWNQYASTHIVSSSDMENRKDILSTEDGNHHVLIMIASREPWYIDHRFLQPNRISEKLYLSTMSYDGRKELIVDKLNCIIGYINASEEKKQFFDGLSQLDCLDEVSDNSFSQRIKELVSQMEGFTGAELMLFFKKIMNTVEKNWMKKNTFVDYKVDFWKDCVYDVGSRIKPLLKKENILPYTQWHQEVS